MACKLDRLHDPLWGDDFIFTGEIEERDGDPFEDSLGDYTVFVYFKTSRAMVDEDALLSFDSVSNGGFFTFPTDTSYRVDIPGEEITDELTANKSYWVKTTIARTVGEVSHVRTHLDDRILFRTSLVS